MTVANGFQIVSIDRVFTILLYIIYILIILTILNNIVKYMVYKTSFLDTYMTIYITVFRCIYVKVLNYTYFLITKKYNTHFFYDKTSGALVPLNTILKIMIV